MNIYPSRYQLQTSNKITVHPSGDRHMYIWPLCIIYILLSNLLTDTKLSQYSHVNSKLKWPFQTALHGNKSRQVLFQSKISDLDRQLPLPINARTFSKKLNDICSVTMGYRACLKKDQPPWTVMSPLKGLKCGNKYQLVYQTF